MKKLTAVSIFLFFICGWGVSLAAIPVYGFKVKNTYPHDQQAFTEGLFFNDGFLYESTGLNGRSTIRKVELATGKVLQKRDISSVYFGEGITEIGGNIIGLTWQSHTGFVFDRKSFKLKRQFQYDGEGWGLASDQQHVYMSDGTSFIRVLNPAMKEVKRFQVTADGVPVDRLNELEWVEGELFANIWGSDLIARINPDSGFVIGWIDLRTLLVPSMRGTPSPDAVLNGIAYDKKQRRLFVTGKLWPKLFEIELTPVQAQ
ncbi:MAG: glutaminyl-peptide cyclotransferase [Rhodoferax sp.]